MLTPLHGRVYPGLDLASGIAALGRAGLGSGMLIAPRRIARLGPVGGTG